MRRILIGCFSVLLLTISLGSYGQRNGTAIMLLKQPSSPAVFILTQHTTKDLLVSAKLKNVSEHPVTGYRIGWVVVYPSGRSKLILGLPVDVPGGIKPGEVAEVPAQSVSPEDSGKEGAVALLIFLADVHSEAGHVWKPDLESIEQAARDVGLQCCAHRTDFR